MQFRQQQRRESDEEARLDLRGKENYLAAMCR